MPNVTEELRTALIDRYVIESELGEGGMATVYLAHDTKHNRKVALKVMKPELAAMIGAERFLKEIEVTANLQHPHILPLHDSGEAQGFLYYVMPFVEGETLRAKLEREKQFAIDDAVELTRAICGALDYAHRQGVIHRDIKPENILLVEGQPQVADFGIALAVSQAGGTRLTETGLSIGTPQYMSPEQAMGDRELDARSDIYSVGAMLYEMLTGDPPYMGSTAQAIVAKVITERAPPVTASRDTVPPHIAASVDKALAKLPADRFATAAQFAEALVTPGFIGLTTQAQAVQGVAPSNRRTTIAFGVAAVAIVVAMWGWFRPQPTVPTVVSRFSVTLPPEEGLQTLSVGHRLAISPDGTKLIYVGPGETAPMLWLRQFDQLSASPISGTEGAMNPFFSPDGESIGFFTERPRTLKVASLVGAPPVSLTDTALGSSGGDWAEDGYIYMDTDRLGMQRIPQGGGPREPVVPLVRDSGEVGVAWPHVLPGGKVIYRMRYSGAGPEAFTINVVDPTSGDTRVLLSAVRAQYAPSGHLVYATAEGQMLAVPFDPSKAEITGSPISLMEGLSLGTYGVVDYDISASGTMMYVTGSTTAVSNLFWLNEDDSTTPVDSSWTPGGFIRWAVALDPSGTRLAFSMVLDGGRSDILIKDLTASGTPVRLTFDGRWNSAPLWTDDGESIVYWSDRNGGTTTLDGASVPVGLYRKRADGSGSVVPIHLPDVSGSGGFDVVGSGDDLQLVMTVQGAEDEADIVSFRPGRDTVATPLIVNDDFTNSPAISPDGRWMAYGEGEVNRRVFVRPFPNVDDGLWEVTDGFGTDPLWSPDGRTIYYGGDGGTMMAATIRTEPTFLVVGRRQLTGSNAVYYSTAGGPFAPAPDGRLLLVGVRGGGEERGQLIVVQGFAEDLRARSE